MSDYLLYIGAKVASFFVCVFPIRFSLFWGSVLGEILYYLLPRRAKISYINLKIAFGDGLTPAERKRITRGVFRNLVMNFIELLYFPKIDRVYIERYVRIIGKDKIDKVLARNKGLIFLAAHFGNWELASLVVQAEGYPMVVLAREQKFKRLNSLLNCFRQRLGSKVISRGHLMRELLTSLRNNEVVGILGDQKAGTTGVLVSFFNRWVWTPTGAMTLSRHTGAGILPAFIIREKGSFHRIELGEELIVDKDDERVLREFNRILEGYIEQYPSQWLWLHRRWKASPNKNILIISDGKAGHLNQARAVANLVKEQTQDKIKSLQFTVYSEVVKIREVEVKFRNKLTKGLMYLFGLSCGKRCIGCLRCLRLCLDKNSYRQTSSFYADIVISCGSNLASLNLILAKENQAKSIVVMRPGIIPIEKFNLAIVPAHDRVKPGRNVVITQAALNLVDEASIKEGIKSLQFIPRLGSATLTTSCSGQAVNSLQDKKIKIGVLIGGEAKNYTLTEEIAKVLIDQLLETAQDLDAQLLVTTSRRTTPGVDRVIKERLSGNEFCPLVIIANEHNLAGAVAGILGLSDIVVVSGESISMVSEALSSQKPVVVFEIEKKRRRDTKHRRFLDNLVKQNYISLVKPQELAEAIKRVYQEPQEIKPLEDKRLVSEAIRKMI